MPRSGDKRTFEKGGPAGQLRDKLTVARSTGLRRSPEIDAEAHLEIMRRSGANGAGIRGLLLDSPLMKRGHCSAG